MLSKAMLLIVLLEVTSLAVYDTVVGRPSRYSAPPEATLPAPFPPPTPAPLPPAPVPPPVLTPIPMPSLITREWLVVTALVTAYTPGPESCGESADGFTSTNRSTDAYPYGIAADRRILAPGSLVKVPEYMDVSFPGRAWEVDDTGGDMRKNYRLHCIVHLDLRYRTVVSANKVGRQWMDVEVDVTGWPPCRRARLEAAAANGRRMRSDGALPK